MDQPLFESKLGGYRIFVYPNRVVYKGLMGTEEAIMTKQIVGVTLGLFFQSNIVIQTADGKKHKLLIKPGEKEKMRDAIYGVMNS